MSIASAPTRDSPGSAGRAIGRHGARRNRPTRIPVARSEDVESEENLLWDSGRGEPYRSVGVEYGDEVLRSGSRFTWEVPVLVGIRNPSPCSVPVVFETGLLKRSKWKGARVSAGDGPDLSMSGRYEFEGRMARG